MKVLTVGSFDIVHAGHVKLFERCAKLGELTVAINTDEFIMSYKNTRPLLSFNERYDLVKRNSFVSRVIPNWSGETLRPLIETEMPDILAIGSDWAVKDYYSQIGVSQDWLDEHNILLIYLPYTKEISVTKVKERCLSQQ